MPPATFRCTWTGCNRSFGKEGQLEKHERSHAGPSRYACHSCGKTYVRSDVLSRHMVSQHGATPPAMGRPRKATCSSCIAAHAVCSGTISSTCVRCRDHNLACSLMTPARPRVAEMTVTSHQDITGSDWHGQMESADQDSHQSMLPPAPNQLEVDEMTSTDLFFLATTASESDDWFNALGIGQDPSQPMDWGFDERDPYLFDVFNTHAPNSPARDILQSLNIPVGTSSQQSMAPSYRSPEELHGAPSEIPDGQPFDSPWPHIDKPRGPDSHVSLPNTTSGGPSNITVTDSLPEQIRESMINIISQSHRAVWPDIDTVNFPSTNTLTVCVNLYHRHFHDTITLQERDSFRLATSPPLIVMAMAAIGAMYSPDGLQRLGLALNELVRRAIFYVRESDRRFVFEINIIQALFLQTSFAFFCGSHKAFQQAETSRSILVQACKRMHLLRPGISAQQSLISRSTIPDPAQLSLAAKEDRRRARLGWCIYLLDSQLACLLNLPAQLALSEVNAPFPSSARLQDGGFTDEGVSFAAVLDQLLTDGVIPPIVDDIGPAVIAHTLYRMCIDTAATQSIRRLPDSSTYPILQFPPHVNHHPQILLDRIRVLALSTPRPPKPLLISCAALANHAHLQFTRLGFIELVKIAAGKRGSHESKRTAQQELLSWINSDFVGVRRITAYAGMLSNLLGRHTFDTPCEVVWIFDCALCLWAITLFSLVPIASGSRVVTVGWSSTDAVEDWIARGGGASIQGLGDLNTLTPTKVLDNFVDRLDQLSWGLAQQYKEVLLQLSGIPPE